MNGKSYSPKSHKNQSSYLHICDRFASSKLDSIEKKDEVGDEEHESPRDVDDRQIIEAEVSDQVDDCIENHNEQE